jgi:hypothetical protein
MALLPLGKLRNHPRRGLAGRVRGEVGLERVESVSACVLAVRDPLSEHGHEIAVVRGDAACSAASASATATFPSSQCSEIRDHKGVG